MCGGVGLFGVFSGVLASWFIGAEHFDVGTELRAMREEVKALRSAVQSASPTRAQGATALPADNAASSDEGP